MANSTLCYLERLAVLPDMRHKGYGRMLVLHASKRAKELGVSKVGIGIIADQNELKSWYADMGFIHVETKKFEHLPFNVAFMDFITSNER
jgi:N-acetylglutamate synthase-like GNAT family acetyltransferase